MKTVFADASYYFTLLMERDQMAPSAMAFTSSYRGQFVTTTAVLTEVANSLSRTPLRGAFLLFVDALQESQRVEMVAETPELWEEALNLFASRLDKFWSLTDCISFLVMQERGLMEAVTADHHFEQAGFTILLK